MIYYPILIREKDDLVEFEILSIIIFGLIIGSFLNVLIYRLPLGISLLKPRRSFCTNCNIKIKWYENIPIISYILLKARCSSCKKKISILYPLVELLTSAITLLLFLKLHFTVEFYFISTIFYLLIVLSFIDLQYKAVPYTLLIVIVTITLFYLFYLHKENLSTFFIFTGTIVTIEFFLTYYIQNVKAKIFNDDSLKIQKALGEGDIPIIAIIGGILGLQFGILAIFLSAILAIIPSLINKVFKNEIETPFIPYLSLSLIIIYLSGDKILNILKGLYLV